MVVPGRIGSTLLDRARAKKRNNALVAVACGAIPAVLFTILFHTGLAHWLVGFAVGLVWGNAFEYSYHRWLLHWPKSTLGRGHLDHHRTAGSVEQVEHITFGRNPLNVVALFVSNGMLLALLEVLFRIRIAPGVLVGWAAYLILLEEIHWRVHMEVWLPRCLQFARAYHLSHHDIPNTRYNVFLPLFDFFFGDNRVAATRMPLQHPPRG